MLIGYAGISTADGSQVLDFQQEALQLEALLRVLGLTGNFRPMGRVGWVH